MEVEEVVLASFPKGAVALKDSLFEEDRVPQLTFKNVRFTFNENSTFIEGNTSEVEFTIRQLAAIGYLTTNPEKVKKCLL